MGGKGGGLVADGVRVGAAYGLNFQSLVDFVLNGASHSRSLFY